MAGLTVKIDNLVKSFADYTVLNDVSLHVDSGENLVILEKAVQAKAFCLNAWSGFLDADKGDIFVGDTDVLKLNSKELNELRKDLGFLFQGAALYDSMSVRENLMFPLIRNFNFTQKELDYKVKVALDRVSLAEAVDKMPSELSGGMRKRIGLARSIITEPKLMLYDEPTTGLDPITAKEISQLIIDLQTELKMTSIAVTHDLLCAKIIADRAVMLRDGKVVFEGALDDMISSKDPFLNNFFN